MNDLFSYIPMPWVTTIVGVIPRIGRTAGTGGAVSPSMDISSFLRDPEPVVMTASVARNIKRSVGQMPAEQGGVLGGQPDGSVSRFRFDRSADRSGVTYSPDVAALNQLMRHQWNPRGTRLMGFVHSHPVGFDRPSRGDAVYASRILSAIDDLDELLLPIVQSAGDGVEYSIRGHRAKVVGRRVVIESTKTVVLPDRDNDATNLPMFDRVTEVYDLPAMSTTRLVVVGVGGAAAFVEEMARAGVGEFVLIDPDTVEEVNLATQQVYRSDIGRPKVEAVADRIREINPACRVWTIAENSDWLSDADFRRVIHSYLPGADHAKPGLTLLCGLTDSFPAQARVSRLARQFGVPMLAAQVYFEGRGAELTFSAPGVTPACGRCVIGGRYRSYLEDGFMNDVGSAGAPLFATTRLNATKAMIALALIHGTHPGADPTHPGTLRWSGLLERIAGQNLVQIRLDPDLGTSLGLKVFDSAFDGADKNRVVTDETLWLPQEPESPATGFARCPDCGGVGDLRSRIGQIDDTSALPVVWAG